MIAVLKMYFSYYNCNSNIWDNFLNYITYDISITVRTVPTTRLMCITFEIIVEISHRETLFNGGKSNVVAGYN